MKLKRLTTDTDFKNYDLNLFVLTTLSKYEPYNVQWSEYYKTLQKQEDSSTHRTHHVTKKNTNFTTERQSAPPAFAFLGAVRLSYTTYGQQTRLKELQSSEFSETEKDNLVFTIAVSSRGPWSSCTVTETGIMK